MCVCPRWRMLDSNLLSMVYNRMRKMGRRMTWDEGVGHGGAYMKGPRKSLSTTSQGFSYFRVLSVSCFFGTLGFSAAGFSCSLHFSYSEGCAGV